MSLIAFKHVNNDRALVSMLGLMILKIAWVKRIIGELSKFIDKVKRHTTLLRVMIGVVYFLLFTFLSSSSLYVAKLNLEVGEPSPQLITAPSDKVIEDLVKYAKEQDAAAKAVQAVYKPDNEYLLQLNAELEKAFADVQEVAALEDESARVPQLQQIPPFTVLAKETLISLMETSPDQLAAAKQTGINIILNRARNGETGARTESDVIALREEIKTDINNSELHLDFKDFFAAFVDQKITQPTLTVDEETTEQLRSVARAEIKKDVLHYKANQKIVGPGEIVDESIYQVLFAYGLISGSNTWKSIFGISLVVLVGMGAIGIYLFQYRRDILDMPNRIVLIGLTMLLVLAIGRGVISLNLGGTEYDILAGLLIPVAWATMSITILIGVDVALLVSVVLAIYVAVLIDPALTTSFGLQTGLVALFGGLVGVYSVSLLSQRSDLARAGLFVSAVNILVVSAIALTTGMRFTVWLVGIILGTINGVVSSFLTVGALHWFESGFRITSSVRLLELSNPNRPLLKRLLMEAPGTYHHSIIVGNLAEAAAEAVHADATLVRVGSLYHDIGKLKRPYFFIENQFTQDNPHDKIAPTLSSLIITSHVKDGLELARENKLPQQIQDIIAQHHGDGIVGFFYHKALEENEQVPEASFHYEGPKPQTKEAALVALADSVEAAVRSLKQPTLGRVEGLVRKIVKDKLNDGQLDQCDLTFQDLDRISIAFVRVLNGIFHSRVQYPELPGGRETGNGTANKKLEEDISKPTAKINEEPVTETNPESDNANVHKETKV